MTAALVTALTMMLAAPATTGSSATTGSDRPAAPVPEDSSVRPPATADQPAEESERKTLRKPPAPQGGPTPAPAPGADPAVVAPGDPSPGTPSGQGSPPDPVPSNTPPVPADSPPVPGDIPPVAPPAPPAAAPAPELSAPLTDGPVAVTAQISPDPSQVGDLIKLELTAAYPAGYTVNLPLGLQFEPLHLVSVDENEPESTGQGFRKIFTITLQHFAVGEAKVPGFPLTWLGPDGAVQTVQVPPTPFTVSSLLANEPDPKRQGEDPPVSLEYPNRRAEIIIYSALAALLVGLVGGLLWARWRRRPRPIVLPPPVPAHVVAFKQLDDLQRAELVEKGAYQDYYLQLTEIAKAYLEGRFGIDALDRTTDELRIALERAAAQIAPLKPIELVRILQAFDLVKFARFAPPGEEAQAALAEVRRMVEATAPKPEAKDKDKSEVKPDDKPEAKPDAQPDPKDSKEVAP